MALRVLNKMKEKLMPMEHPSLRLKPIYQGYMQSKLYPEKKMNINRHSNLGNRGIIERKMKSQMKESIVSEVIE